MTILDALLSGVGVVGNVLDTPGAIVRNTFSGRDPFSGLNPFDAEGRASGRDMLESWGWLGQNEEGLDWGDAAGFGAELLTDPLNLIGGGVAKNTSLLAKEAKAANAANDLSRQVVQRAADFHNAGSALPEAVLRAAGPPKAASYFEKLLLAEPREAADMFARRHNLTLTDADRYAADFYRHSPAHAFGFAESPHEAGALALVPKSRRDIALFSPEASIGSAYDGIPSSVPAHETLHNMVGMFPESHDMLRASLGDTAVDDGWLRYASLMSPDDAASIGPSVRSEEGLATLFERANGVPFRDARPIDRLLSAADSPGRSPDIARGVRGLGMALDSVGRSPLNSPEAARLYAGFLTSDPSVLADLGPRAVYGSELLQSSPNYTPLPKVSANPLSFIPENSPIPSQLPLLGALLGHHALARGSQF